MSPCKLFPSNQRVDSHTVDFYTVDGTAFKAFSRTINLHCCRVKYLANYRKASPSLIGLNCGKSQLDLRCVCITLMLPYVFFFGLFFLHGWQVATAVQCDQLDCPFSCCHHFPTAPKILKDVNLKPETQPPHKTFSYGFPFGMIASQICKWIINQWGFHCNVVFSSAVTIQVTNGVNGDKTPKMSFCFFIKKNKKLLESRLVNKILNQSF